MHTALECIPCFLRQALEAVRFVTEDTATHERVLRDVLRAAAEMDMTQSPPAVGQWMHRHLRQLTGVVDPYRAVKDRFNKMAMEMLPELSVMVGRAADPLAMAMRFAIAGNVIDLGANGELAVDEVRQAVIEATGAPLHGDLDDFRQAASTASEILYLADNAGEIVFDGLLIEQLPSERVTVAVRGGPVLNDATLADAEAASLYGLVEVIDNGSDAPGTILGDCSAEFRRRFAEADMVIAKGQGNFETLSDAGPDVYFMFKAKCPVIANHIGLPVGTHVAARWQTPLPILGGREDART